MHIPNFETFPMRTFETRLCSSKNTLFHTMTKPEIPPKNRTEFQENKWFSLFRNSEKRAKWRESNVKEKWFSKTENMDYACWERLKTLKNHENDMSLTLLTLDSCSWTGWVQNWKRWFCLLGKHSKQKKYMEISPKNHKKSKFGQILKRTKTLDFSGGSLANCG